MTLNELRDIIVMRYKVEALKRGIETIDITKNEKFFASLIAEGQQEVQRILAVLRSSTTITTVAGTREYSLPHLFGRETLVFDPQYGKLEPQLLVDIQAVDTTNNARPVEYSIREANPSKIVLNPTPDAEYSVDVHYVVSPKLYSPSASSQEWGSFDGYDYTGDLLLPDEYLIAVWQYVVASLVDDYYAVYRKTLNSLKQSRRFIQQRPKYRMGGYAKKSTNFIQYGSSTPTTGSSKVYDKHEIIYYDGADFSNTKTGDFSSALTAVKAGSVVTITSSGGEFVEGKTFVKSTTDYLYGYTSSSEITVTIMNPAVTKFSIEIYIEA